jgi:hypothetical protein
MENNLIGQYVSNKKIKSTEKSERKTFLGKEVTLLTYEDDSKEEFPSEQLWLQATPQPCDLTQLREKAIVPVVEKILAILLEAEIKVIDIEYMTQKIIMSIRDHIDRANKKLWGKEYYDQTLFDVHNVLTQKNELLKKNKITSGGGISSQLSNREGNGKASKDKESTKSKPSASA